MPIIAAVMATSELRFGFPVAACAAVVFGCNNDISEILLEQLRWEQTLRNLLHTSYTQRKYGRCTVPFVFYKNNASIYRVTLEKYSLRFAASIRISITHLLKFHRKDHHIHGRPYKKLNHHSNFS